MHTWFEHGCSLALSLLLLGCGSTIDLGPSDAGSTDGGAPDLLDADVLDADLLDADLLDADLLDAGIPPIDLDSLCPSLRYRSRPSRIESLVAVGLDEAFFVQNRQVLHYRAGSVEVSEPDVPDGIHVSFTWLGSSPGGPILVRHGYLAGSEWSIDLHRWDGSAWTPLSLPDLPRDFNSRNRLVITAQGDRLLAGFTQTRELFERVTDRWVLLRTFEHDISWLAASPSTLAVTLSTMEGGYRHHVRGRDGSWVELSPAVGIAWVAGDFVIRQQSVFDGMRERTVDALGYNHIGAGLYRGEPYVMSWSQLVSLADLDAPAVYAVPYIQSVSFPADGPPWIGRHGLMRFDGGGWVALTPIASPPFSTTVSSIAGTPDDFWMLQSSSLSSSATVTRARGDVHEYHRLPLAEGDSPGIHTTSWLALTDDGRQLIGTLRHGAILARERTVIRRFPMTADRTVVAGGGDSVWVASGTEIFRLEGEDLVLIDTIPIPIEVEICGLVPIEVDATRTDFWAWFCNGIVVHRVDGEWVTMPEVPGEWIRVLPLRGGFHASGQRAWLAASRGLGPDRVTGIYEWDGASWTWTATSSPTTWPLLLIGRGDDVVAYNPSLNQWRREPDGTWTLDESCNVGVHVSTAWWPEGSAGPWYFGMEGLIFEPNPLD